MKNKVMIVTLITDEKVAVGSVQNHKMQRDGEVEKHFINLVYSKSRSDKARVSDLGRIFEGIKKKCLNKNVDSVEIVGYPLIESGFREPFLRKILSGAFSGTNVKFDIV